MEKNLLDIIRIGVFYDGYYFYKVSNYYKYEHIRKSRISISGLQNFIRKKVGDLTKTDFRQCQIIDSHYFRGRSSAKELGEKVQNERVFEDILMRENIVTHYLPLRIGHQEKGIDVWLALEAYELSIYKHFDVLVLVAGDGDYVPLVRKLHTLGTQVMLLCWDFSYHNENGDLMETRTSRQLLDEVFCPVVMSQRIDEENGEDIRNLFMTDNTVNDIRAQEYFSTILSLNTNGFGFIRDVERNNVFFHYGALTNRDFADLDSGMRVKYRVEEDAERTKRDGVPRYRAHMVTVLDER
ncbi:MAG: NYN domain-containing protein [Acidobacteriota bacterium]|jgi:cold shock CspA family protein/uncharacterized LabA/DUF88 family protein|nr:NYN domain-containing protein [Acidobacteriota bacterium]